MLELIRDPRDISALREDWSRLAQGLRSPFLSHEWFQACAEVCGPTERPTVVVVSGAGGVEAIAPLAETKGPKGSTFEILGSSMLGELRAISTSRATARGSLRLPSPASTYFLISISLAAS